MAEPRTILLLGTPHFDNPGLDMANIEVDDVLGATRQDEIHEVVDALLAFEPTALAVELPIHLQDRVDEAYESSCAGTRTLGRSEAEQLGFRTALLAGLPSPRAIDVVDVFYDPAIDGFLELHPELKRVFDGMLSWAQDEAETSEQRLRVTTISQYLRGINTTQARRDALQPYIEYLVPIAAAGQYPGADMAANWYRRNLKIAANLIHATGAGERVLVIYGAGHIPVLEHILGLMPDVTLVDPLAYLR